MKRDRPNVSLVVLGEKGIEGKEKEKKGNVLSSMYVKKDRAPPGAPRLIYLTMLTQSFRSSGSGRAFSSMRNIIKIRASSEQDGFIRPSQ